MVGMIRWFSLAAGSHSPHVDALQLRWTNSEGKLLAALGPCPGVGFVPICRAASALLGLPQWVSYSSMHLKQTK